MIPFTLIPEARLYATALIAVSSSSCGAIADYLIARLFPSRAQVFLPVYLSVMAAVALFALAVMDLPVITAVNGVTAAVSVPLGIVTGISAERFGAHLKRAALRRWSRQHRGRLALPLRNARTGLTPGYWPSAATGLWLPDDGYGRLTGLPSSRWGSLAMLVVAGMLEEVLFRGVLVQLCLSLGSPAFAVPCLAGTVVIFTLSHLELGYDEVFAKLPLGSIALGVVVITGSILPAVFGHVYLNVRSWRVRSLRAPDALASGAL